MFTKSTQSLLCALAVSGLAVGSAYGAGSSNWTDAGPDHSWATDANWDTPPAFDGTDDIFIGNISSDETMVLGGDRDINSIEVDPGNGPIVTIGNPGTSDTLTLRSGSTTTPGAFWTKYVGGAIVNTDIKLGANATFFHTEYHDTPVFNGSIGETGGSHGLTLNTDGGRSTFLMGDNTYTGATIIVDGRENYLGGSSQTSSVTVQEGSISIGGSDSLGSGPLTLEDGSVFDSTADAVTVNNATSMSGSVSFDSVNDFAANHIPGTDSDNKGHGAVTFANTVALTGDTSIASEGYYKRSAGPHFAGGFSGNHSLTYTGGRWMVITGASTYTGGTTINDSSFAVTAAGGLGTGDVTLNKGLLSLEALDAIDSGAALTLGDAAGDSWSLNLDFSGTQTVSALTVDGNTIAPGTTYSASDYSGSNGEISGDGQLLVVVPEPASLALLGIGGGLMMLRRRRGATPEA